MQPATIISAAAIAIGVAGVTVVPSRAADLGVNGDREYRYSERSVDREVRSRDHRDYSRSTHRYVRQPGVVERRVVERPTIIERHTIVEPPFVEHHVFVEEPVGPPVVFDPVLAPIVRPPPPFLGYVADDDYDYNYE